MPCTVTICHRKLQREALPTSHCAGALDTALNLALCQVLMTTTGRGHGTWLCARLQAVVHVHVTPLVRLINRAKQTTFGGFFSATSECKHPPGILSGLIQGIFMLLELLL